MAIQASLDSVYFFCKMKAKAVKFWYLKDPKPGLFHSETEEMSPEQYLLCRNTILMTPIFKKMEFGE